MEFCLVNGEAATFYWKRNAIAVWQRLQKSMRGCGIGYGNQTGNKENFKTYLDEQKESEYVVLVGTVGKVPY